MAIVNYLVINGVRYDIADKDHDDIYAKIGGKQNTLTFDTTPTTGSNNPVSSSGIKEAIDLSAAVATISEIQEALYS